MIGLIGNPSRRMKGLGQTLENIGSGVLLLFRTLIYLPTLPRQIFRLVEQCFQMGYTTLPLVAFLSISIGGVLALLSGYALQNFNANNFIGTIVGVGMAWELGPTMTALLVAGRVGSAITAELASMKVYHEVDALNTMNIPPERFLVLPRLLAMILVMPILTIVSITFGWLGGMVVAEYVDSIKLDPQIYLRSLRDSLETGDIIDGLCKGEIFGVSIVIICCNVGLQTRGGPREIGHAVTRGVVASMTVVLVLNYFVTKALL